MANPGQISSRGNIWATLKALVDNGLGAVPKTQLSGFGPIQAAKATYDFSVDGGATATIELKNSPTIPAGAIVMGGIIDPITNLTSGGGATVAVGFGTGGQAAVLKAATAFASFNALLSVLPIWTTGFVQVTADSKISITVAAATLTAGKFSVHIVYFLAGE